MLVRTTCMVWLWWLPRYKAKRVETKFYNQNQNFSGGGSYPTQDYTSGGSYPSYDYAGPYPTQQQQYMQGHESTQTQEIPDSSPRSTPLLPPLNRSGDDPQDPRQDTKPAADENQS